MHHALRVLAASKELRFQQL